ncbi:hypothetical protein HN992_01890 [Candidatus Woesearchaeota archaeon]|jgi:hypothetical protein|nr:hypothetical protein [archaeon]MBT3438525.1 hypothetical protein [Candidatus Woesearchaeota archaeon]MBT4058048.1 hypothetical protein [Candidatus Woesearchaeota archaeon]MBT4208338.1 hypothetical protein [Candidatus Woesearchaeota archaeon]MBT4730821.1 hypothetical protein [Candidatus Woesearchaeota archaeon]
MDSPDRKKMDRYYKEQLGDNIEKELASFDEVMAMMVDSILPKKKIMAEKKNYAETMFRNWDCFSEILPPLREVKWNLMSIKKYRDLSSEKGHELENLSNDDKKVRKKCVNSMLWFTDVLAYSSGLVKDELKTRKMFGFEE